MPPKNKEKSKPTIIIKKIVDEGHHGHHGGAWKVAYADFVTAMMAFFLLLWILNSVQEETLEGIADYFTPTMVPQAGLGGDGLLDGGTVGPDGTLNSSDSPLLTIATPLFGQDDPGQNPNVDDNKEESNPVIIEYESPNPTTDPTEIEKVLSEINDAKNKAALADLETQIVQAMQAVPDLKPLLPNILFEETPEGLRIQIVDKDGQDMFPSGSSQMYEATQDIIRLVGQAAAKLNNKMVITGHTDSVPYKSNNGYSNWELSSDRANATRRVLVESGVNQARIARVSGVAEFDPLIKENPLDPSNRRISIVLMYNEISSESDMDRNINTNYDTTPTNVDVEPALEPNVNTWATEDSINTQESRKNNTGEKTISLEDLKRKSDE